MRQHNFNFFNQTRPRLAQLSLLLLENDTYLVLEGLHFLLAYPQRSQINHIDTKAQMEPIEHLGYDSSERSQVVVLT